jgi:hypothetical protein
MEVSGRHACARAVIRDTHSPANRTVRRTGDASRGFARVVSDVSVLCPRCVADTDNECDHLPDEFGPRSPSFSLEMDAELTQVYECCFAPADGVGGERKREGHPALLSQRLTIAQDVVVAGRGLDAEAGGFEPADELADVLPHCSRLSSAGSRG